VFPVRHELDLYILFRRNSVVKGLIYFISQERKKYTKRNQQNKKSKHEEMIFSF
jgi:hypothetical protein